MAIEAKLKEMSPTEEEWAQKKDMESISLWAPKEVYEKMKGAIKCGIVNDSMGKIGRAHV